MKSTSTPIRHPTLRTQSAAQGVAAQLQMALSAHKEGNLDLALAFYEQILQIQPKHFDALHLSGVAQLSRGHPEIALVLLDKALKIDRVHDGALNNRGAACMALRQYPMALLNFNKAISLAPGSALAYNNRGNALIKLTRLEAAVADFDKAIALNPNYFSAHNNRAIALSDLGRYDEARISLQRALELDPQSVDAHWNLGMCLLRLGEFEQGWLESEWRLKRPQALGLRDTYPSPAWTGVEPLEGKTILVCSEQGLGDTIQFCRYAPLLARSGCRVILEVPSALLDLLRKLPDVEVLPQGQPLPVHHYHCALMSLPKLLKTDLENMPPAAPVEVFRADAERRRIWSERLGEQRKLRVGIVWSGNPSHVDDHKRSIALQDFASLLTDEVEWISLHKDVRTSDQAVLANQPRIRHFGSEQQTFADVAALCELVDIVVAIDTSLAHLAASQGKPTWVLLSHNADWRWLLERRDSPWYERVTVYRQHQPGDWPHVLARVKADLIERAIEMK